MTHTIHWRLVMTVTKTRAKTKTKWLRVAIGEKKGLCGKNSQTGGGGWPKPTPYFSLFFPIQGLGNFSHIIPFFFWQRPLTSLAVTHIWKLMEVKYYLKASVKARTLVGVMNETGSLFVQPTMILFSQQWTERKEDLQKNKFSITPNSTSNQEGIGLFGRIADCLVSLLCSYCGRTDDPAKC